MNIKRAVGKMIAALSLLVIGFFTGCFLTLWQYEQSAEVVETNNEERFDLRLPGEAEKRVVTTGEIEAKLLEIGQLATYSEEYTIYNHGASHTRHILDDIPIPLTTNTISITCSGIVKVGYDVHDIIPTVDNDSQKIYIALPAPSVLDNYVIWNSVEYTEANNILNPIDFAEYQILLGEIEQKGLVQAEEDGIYAAAEESVKTIIRNFLAGFEGYEVVFL